MIDLKNIKQFMEQAKKIQEQLKDKQNELAKQTVVGQAGGGLISIKLNCQYDNPEINLDPAFSNEDRAVQQDLIKAALNDTLNKVRQTLQNSISDLTAQLPTGEE